METLEIFHFFSITIKDPIELLSIMKHNLCIEFDAKNAHISHILKSFVALDLELFKSEGEKIRNQFFLNKTKGEWSRFEKEHIDND